MSNRKTTIAGILTIIAAIALAVKGVLMGATVDWGAVITSIIAAITGMGLWASKDGGT